METKANNNECGECKSSLFGFNPAQCHAFSKH